ncbi:MAG: phosphoglycerate kinase [Hyphomicrobiaceae bacterium]
MARFKTLDDVDLHGRRVLVRVDINVPIEAGRVTDTTRIRAIVPTIKDILAAGGIPVLIAHFGRPQGRYVPELSLAPLRAPLADLVGAPVLFVADDGVRSAWAQTSDARPGDVVLLENIRFYPGEESNDPGFVRALAALGDIYVNDAFSAAHRAHASTEGLAKALPAVAGRQMQAELEALSAVLDAPKGPTAALVGGAKVSSKIDVLTNLVTKVDRLIVGGGMANTFLIAKGHAVGKSLAETDLAATAKRIIARAEQCGCTILLPVDVRVAMEFKSGAPSRIVGVDAVGPDDMILDVGPKTIAALTEAIATCRTLLWNGPLGAFEIAPFGEGTFAVARAAASQTRAGHLTSVAGGGDTVAALNAAEATDGFSYVSTAGGAFLEWLEGKTLPGIAALEASAA